MGAPRDTTTAMVIIAAGRYVEVRMLCRDGHLAVTEGAGDHEHMFVVTHIPSGRRAAWFPSLERAKNAMEAVSGMADWSTDEIGRKHLEARSELARRGGREGQ